MSELLKLLTSIQTLSSWRSLLTNAGYVAVGLFVIYLWRMDAGLARLLSYFLAIGLLYLGLMIFLKAPAGYAKYLYIKAIFLVLSLFRMASKAIVMGIALLLSFIYFISPIDIIPDILIGLGWIDDALIAFGLISFAANSKITVPVPDPENELEFQQNPRKYQIISIIVATVLVTLARLIT